jgi:NADPH:quinone reductase-like Zn-dependent oxidoreductase
MKTKLLMKAVRIHEYGGEHTLRTEQITLPEISNDEVLVRVNNTSVNPVDWKVRKGELAELNIHQLPLTLGWDVSGQIAQVGANVTDFHLEEEVYALANIGGDGAYAEYVAINAAFVARKPKTLSHSHSAAIPLASLTAWQALDELAQLKAGNSILINGASGGVGSFAVQFAKLAGAEVTAVASKPNHEYLLSLGANYVVDYNTEGYLETLGQFDVVFDIVDNDIAGIYDKVKATGKYISTLKVHEIPAQYTFEHKRVFVAPSGSQLAQIAKKIDSNQIIIPEITEMNIDEIAKAHRLSETEHVRGKIVLSI